MLGAIAGFITLIRWQNVLFALLPAFEAIGMLVASLRSSDTRRTRATFIAGLTFTACATIAFLPQMLAWKSIYGSYLAVSPVGPQIRWWDPHLIDVLWSSRNGLLSWSPILYVGAIGLFLFAARWPAVGVPSLIAVAVMVENGESGSGVAAPVVKQVMDAWLLDDNGQLKAEYATPLTTEVGQR